MTHLQSVCRNIEHLEAKEVYLLNAFVNFYRYYYYYYYLLWAGYQCFLFFIFRPTITFCLFDSSIILRSFGCNKSVTAVDRGAGRIALDTKTESPKIASVVSSDKPEPSWFGQRVPRLLIQCFIRSGQWTAERRFASQLIWCCPQTGVCRHPSSTQVGF